MTVENGLIFMQAARGVRSHFNIQTAFDGIVFSTMGIFIIVNTLLILYTIILFFSHKIELEAPILWAWRVGLIFFFLGGISGGIMSGLLTHTIGAEDGGLFKVSAACRMMSFPISVESIPGIPFAFGVYTLTSAVRVFSSYCCN